MSESILCKMVSYLRLSSREFKEKTSQQPHNGGQGAAPPKDPVALLSDKACGTAIAFTFSSRYPNFISQLFSLPIFFRLPWKTTDSPRHV